MKIGMIEFERSTDYKRKIIIAALDGHVVKDAKLRCTYDSGKLRMRCDETQSWVQCPKSIRIYKKNYIADLVLMSRKDQQNFYRAYKTSIRDTDGNVVG